MTGRERVVPRAAAWVRRLAVLLSVLAALVAVRGPVCTDGMASDTSPFPTGSMSMILSGPDAAPMELGLASMPTGGCPALVSAADGSTTGLVSCMQAAPTALNGTGAAALPTNQAPGSAIAPPAASPPMIADVVLHCALTLHQLCLLRR